MIKAFPKIFAIGTDYIKDIFAGTVEISEKVDGSQMGFGVVEGDLFIRSKGAQLYVDNADAMFMDGVSYIQSIQERLPEGIAFYGEYLRTPKHNTIKYNRIPQNHIVLFGAMDIKRDSFINNFSDYAPILGLEVVPKWEANITSSEDLRSYLERESFLGGSKIEGVVVKNYNRPFLLGGQPIPIMAGKYVSEAFKEVHKSRWGTEEAKSGKWETFLNSFRTEARWNKAIQCLRERGEIEDQPRDIGKLIKAINNDIEDEEMDAVKDWLWSEYKGDIMRSATRGFPEWYKNKLMERSF